MTLRGHVEGGQILLDEPVSLPDGASVQIEVVGAKAMIAGKRHSVLDIPVQSLGGILRPLDSDDDILAEMLEERL